MLFIIHITKLGNSRRIYSEQVKKINNHKK